MNLSSVAVLWFGGHLVDSGSMPIGNLTAFLAYILQILLSVLMAVMMVILVPRAAASADRIEEVIRLRRRSRIRPARSCRHTARESSSFGT